jgi:hypothetical protein
MDIAQYNLFTHKPDVPHDVVERVKHLLREYPFLRDSYAMLIGQFWLEFDGLDRFIPEEQRDEFLRWIANATKPKTIQNRCLEVQRELPELDSRPRVRDLRNAQAKQGIVK